MHYLCTKNYSSYKTLISAYDQEYVSVLLPPAAFAVSPSFGHQEIRNKPFDLTDMEGCLGALNHGKTYRRSFISKIQNNAFQINIGGINNVIRKELEESEKLKCQPSKEGLVSSSSCNSEDLLKEEKSAIAPLITVLDWSRSASPTFALRHNSRLDNLYVSKTVTG